MLRQNRIRGLALSAVLILGVGLRGATPTVHPRIVTTPPPNTITLTGLTINPGFIIAMYNLAVQTPNRIINTLPPDLQQWASFVNISMNNPAGPQSPFFHLTVQYQNCQGISYVGDAGVITSLAPIPNGPSTLNGAQIQVYNSSFALPNPSGVQASPCFQSSIFSQFSNPNQILQAVQQLMQTTFLVCLQECTKAGAVFGTPVCTTVQFFNQSSTNVVAAPIIITPHNNPVCTNLPLFVWTEAMAPGMLSSAISYRFELSQGENPGDPIIQTIMIPAGQVYYQWKASDHQLLPNIKYWFRVTALNATGSPLASGGNGSNVWKWFLINCTQSNGVTLLDVDGWCRTAVAAEPSLAKIKLQLDLMKIQSLINPSDITNDIYTEIKNGNDVVTGVQVSTH